MAYEYTLFQLAQIKVFNFVTFALNRIRFDFNFDSISNELSD